MNFLHHPEKLPEKLEQSDLMACGYRLGKKEGVGDFPRQIYAETIVHGNLIKAISELIAPYIHNSKNNGV
jgi:hypothetical protein